jgi:hypothetical protein
VTKSWLVTALLSCLLNRAKKRNLGSSEWNSLGFSFSRAGPGYYLGGLRPHC